MIADDRPRGRVHSLQISNGGVPKLAVPSIQVEVDGIVGDDQNDKKHHGGPTRAVCLLALEVIEALQSEGHPIAPGATGENVTVAELGVDFPRGSRLAFEGGVVLEINKPAVPCPKIAAAFHDGRHRHLDAALDARRARHYARVLVPGRIATGAPVELLPPRDA